jgi:ATP-dependent DNA helicase RecG
MTQPRQRVFKGISQRAKEALESSEGIDVEFKEALSGLNSDDIVAFANSDLGGAILVGVREVQKKSGKSKAQVTGCDVGDRAKQAVLSRAQNCTPPIDVEVFLENTGTTPFLRIEVPSGPHKPYCTSGGTYKIRGDGRIKALPPGLLLSMFVEKESHQFLTRFRESTEEMEHQLKELKEEFFSQLLEIDQTTERFRDEVEGTLSEIGQSAEAARNESEAASNLASEIHEWVQGVWSDVNAYGRDMEVKIDALLLQTGVPDPTMDRDLEAHVVEVWGVQTRDNASLDDVMKQVAKEHPAATVDQLGRIRSGVEELTRRLEPDAKMTADKPRATSAKRRQKRF